MHIYFYVCWQLVELYTQTVTHIKMYIYTILYMYVHINELNAILCHLTQPQAIHIHTKSAIQNARSSVRFSPHRTAPLIVPLVIQVLWQFLLMSRLDHVHLVHLYACWPWRCRLQEPVDVAAWHALYYMMEQVQMTGRKMG